MRWGEGRRSDFGRSVAELFCVTTLAERSAKIKGMIVMERTT